MSTSFEYSNVTLKNTKIKDKVYYLQSSERGHLGITRGVTHYNLVEVIGKTNERWKVRYKWETNSFVYVTGNHLYTRESVEKIALH